MEKKQHTIQLHSPENISIVPDDEDKMANPPIFFLLLMATLSFRAATAPFQSVVYRNLFMDEDFCSEESNMEVDNDDDAFADDDDDDEIMGVGRIWSDGFKDTLRSRHCRPFMTGSLAPVAPELIDRMCGKAGVSEWLNGVGERGADENMEGSAAESFMVDEEEAVMG